MADKKILFNLGIVGIFGFFGAISRYLLYLVFAEIRNAYVITLGINILGSFLFGLASQFTFRYRKEIMSGFLGSFTTFATFELELYFMAEINAYLLELLYISLSVILGLSAFGFGVYVGQYMSSKSKNHGLNPNSIIKQNTMVEIEDD